MSQDPSPLEALVAAWMRRAETIPLAVLSAPVVRLVDDTSADVLVCRRVRDRRESLLDHGVLALVDADSSEVFAAPLSALAPEPIELPIEAEAMRIDLRRLIPPGRNPKHALVRALVRHQTSDGRRLELTASKLRATWTGTDGSWVKATVMPDVTLHDAAPLGASSDGPALAPTPPPSDPFPCYQQRPTGPAPPELGVAITAARVLVREPGAPWLLEGAFNLAVPVEDRAPAREQAADDAEPPAPTAIVRGAILLVGSDEPGPWVVPVILPSYAPIHPTRLTALATGFFAIDLLALDGIPTREQTYFVHLFAGNAHAGPAASALLSPWTVRAEMAAAETPVGRFVPAGLRMPAPEPPGR